MFLTADRAGLTYREFATSGKALAEAQMLVQDRFGIDAITACSDAFRLSADLGGEMSFPENQPPYLERPLITCAGDISKLGRPDPTTRGSRMADRVLAISEMVTGCGSEVAILGWVDLPFAEACSLCGLTNFMMMLIDDPSFAHKVLQSVTDMVIDFAIAQVEAGADMIGSGDAAASLISPDLYSEFALPYEQRVFEAIHKANCLAKLHVCGNTTNLLDKMAECGADLFNVDHQVPFELARDVYTAHGKCFKGNLDPVSEIMQVSPEECEQNARRLIELAKGTQYMLSPGCEIPAGTPDEVFRAFCSAVDPPARD